MQLEWQGPPVLETANLSFESELLGCGVWPLV